MPKLEEKELQPLTPDEELRLLNAYSELKAGECRHSDLHAVSQRPGSAPPPLGFVARARQQGAAAHRRYFSIKPSERFATPVYIWIVRPLSPVYSPDSAGEPQFE